jgi:hypothetical protein
MNEFQKELSFQSLARKIHYRQLKLGLGKEVKPDIGLVNF